MRNNISWAISFVIIFVGISWLTEPKGVSIADLTLPAGTAESVSPGQQRFLDKLMAEFPCGYSVSLAAFQDPESDAWGWTTWDDTLETYAIHIYSLAPRAMVQETIMHEYAHVLVWDACQDTPHDGIYWAAYGNLYRFTIDE